MHQLGAPVTLKAMTLEMLKRCHPCPRGAAFLDTMKDAKEAWSNCRDPHWLAWGLLEAGLHPGPAAREAVEAARQDANPDYSPLECMVRFPLICAESWHRVVEQIGMFTQTPQATADRLRKSVDPFASPPTV